MFLFFDVLNIWCVRSPKDFVSMSQLQVVTHALVAKHSELFNWRHTGFSRLPTSKQRQIFAILSGNRPNSTENGSPVFLITNIPSVQINRSALPLIALIKILGLIPAPHSSKIAQILQNDFITVNKFQSQNQFKFNNLS